MKSEVYSWRLSSTLKNALEETAREEQATVSSLLERIVTEWLGDHRLERNLKDEGQQQLHTAAARTFGTIAGGNPNRSMRARETIRAKLSRRHAR